jgi:hypothetical protein
MPRRALVVGELKSWIRELEPVNKFISQSSGTSKRVTGRLPLGGTARFSSHPVTFYTTLGEGKVSAIVGGFVRKR